MTQIELLALDRERAEALAAEPQAFARRHGLTLGTNWPVVAETALQTARFLASSPAEAPWGSYLAVDGAERLLVGCCAFKWAPDADGAVEIAYFTFPGDEGRGVATGMARSLVEVANRAARNGAPVALVRAHTLPEHNASCRVLEKNGFRRVGEVVDPEDGLVWRWEQRADDGRR